MLIENIVASVPVNGVYVRPRDLQSLLGYYSFNLFCWNDHDTFKVSLLGSASPIFYKGHFLVLCTGHQIKHIDPKNICVLTPDREFAVTTSGYKAPPIDPEGRENEIQDIVAFDFNGACKEYPALKRRFFQIEGFPTNFFGDDVVAILNYGYPSNDQLYDLYDNNRIASRRRATTLEVHGQPLDETLLRLKPPHSLTFDPDGLSGGPNYVIQRSGKDFTALFAGVTVRAGKEKLYIVKSSYIKKCLLDDVIGDRDCSTSGVRFRRGL